jgi:hypothetical protein
MTEKEQLPGKPYPKVFEIGTSHLKGDLNPGAIPMRLAKKA